MEAGRELKILNFDEPVIHSEPFSIAYSRQPLLIDMCAFEMKKLGVNLNQIQSLTFTSFWLERKGIYLGLRNKFKYSR